MDTQPGALARWFLETWTGTDREEEAALDAALAEALTEARRIWPRVTLAPEAFARHAGRHAPADRPPRAALALLHLSDLYLAGACAEQQPEALSAFDARILSRMPAFLAGLRPSEELIDSTRQVLREKLFMGTVRTAAKIGQYGGRGSLEGWVRVAAVRAALNLSAPKAAGDAPLPDEDAAVARAAMPVGADPELDYLKSRYRTDVAAAFREALASLEGRERTLLRFHYVDALPPGRIATIYNVHRTTVMRWIEAAEAELFNRTRARVIERLGLTPAECDSLLALVRSRLDVTLGGLIRPDQD